MPTTLIDDQVWWDQERKLKGICEQIAAFRAGGSQVLLLAHFEGTLATVESALRTHSIEIKRISQFDSAVLCLPSLDSTGKVWSGLARSFQATRAGTPHVWGATRLRSPVETPYQKPLQIIVTEHHPMRSKDEHLIESAATITCEAQLTVHIALDDPLLTHFGVRSIQNLYQRLGIDEETALSNPMITTAIRRAQEKIESQVPRDLPAWSIEDWFRHNL
jgi:preprotein translocase subunit SecA